MIERKNNAIGLIGGKVPLVLCFAYVSGNMS